MIPPPILKPAKPKLASNVIRAAIVVVILLAAIGLLVLVGPRFKAPTPNSLVRIAHADPELQAAIAASRKQLPMFEQRLKHPEPGDSFAIKSNFKTPEGPEYLWLKNPVKTKLGFTGVVDQAPIAAKDLHKGQRVDVPEANVVDWLVKRADGSMAGGATDLVLGGAPH